MLDERILEITYVVQLFAGEKVTVYDRTLHEAFPSGATDICVESWQEAQDTGIPACWTPVGR